MSDGFKQRNGELTPERAALVKQVRMLQAAIRTAHDVDNRRSVHENEHTAGDSTNEKPFAYGVRWWRYQERHAGWEAIRDDGSREQECCKVP